MKDVASSSDLEKLVVRIHKLIEPADAIVTWNDKIRDPHTGQSRQIDGTIKRNGKVIHIECRDQGHVQDVKWIEELIGRRASLRVDGMLAVSTSGFTRPAAIKASEFGIILRAMSEMTDAEIHAWGNTTRLVRNYIDVRHLLLVLTIDSKHRDQLSKAPVLRISHSSIAPVILILQTLSERPDFPLFVDRNTNVSTKIQLPGLRVDEIPVLDVDVQLKARLRVEEVNAIGVWNYRGVEPSSSSDAIVTRHGSRELEVIQHGDLATMIVDLSSAKAPLNCYPLTTMTDLGRTSQVQITPIGIRFPPDVTIDASYKVRTISIGPNA